MNWTDGRVEELKKLWDDGLSATQIADKLGGVSRNAVIGKVHRLKLSVRGRTPAKPARLRRVNGNIHYDQSVTAKALNAPQSVVSEPVVRHFDDVVVPVSKKLELVELSETTCKWPSGDLLTKNLTFCGNEAGDKGPYCTYHSRLAYQPASLRGRLR